MSLTIGRELALAQARALARAGRLDEAAELLADPGLESDVATLDLLARVHAQRGDLDLADRYWADAERLAPGRADIAAGRRRIAALRPASGRRPRRLPVRTTGAVLAAVAVLALLIDIRSQTAALRAAPPPVATVTVPAAPPMPTPSPSPSEIDVLDRMNLRIPGVRVRRSPQEISVAFQEPLFSRDTTLTRRGRAALDRLGARLAAHAGGIEVAVIGHTDRQVMPPGGEYTGNTELGLARALQVREILRAKALIPTARFAVSSMGAAMPPFRDDARNRTVTLRISGARG
ncbi:flagellar motor protein MotB [Spongiactinospora rosea]|uniref:Flagellar motor protein MotB n=1 Tax=Spongiactinospora rosea TaxID=2248750 RepID=A0A366LQV2_9ACTN|nr:OmpA family protein [Spongiactinospora rosea]RBQ16286.1 flagellar motor protein MotB [Spongiactinospora rosea]